MTNAQSPRPMTESGPTEIRGNELRNAQLAQGGGMEVLCAFDERYLPHTATMLCSLLEHNTVSRIHLFYSSADGQEPRELERLESFVARYGGATARYKMDPEHFRDFRVDKWVSVATYYRILAARILPTDIDRVFYLDSDMIVRSSLAELWNTDLSGRALAAVGELADSRAVDLVGLPSGAKYFNCGVLLINLEFWRRNNVYERAAAFIRSNPDKVELWDQDALNAILVGLWVEIPAYWNAQSHFITGLPATRVACLTTEQRAMVPIADPAVVHFDGASKPWHWSFRHPFQNEYHKYRLKTPWPRYELEGRPRLDYRLRQSLRSLARTVLAFRPR
jgi:lipopolysaccharide biosynthesis glycosyltransferase